MNNGANQKRLKMEREQERKVNEEHRKTIFTAGGNREGLMDRPYDEGEIL